MRLPTHLVWFALGISACSSSSPTPATDGAADSHSGSLEAGSGGHDDAQPGRDARAGGDAKVHVQDSGPVDGALPETSRSDGGKSDAAHADAGKTDAVSAEATAPQDANVAGDALPDVAYLDASGATSASCDSLSECCTNGALTPTEQDECNDIANTDDEDYCQSAYNHWADQCI